MCHRNASGRISLFARFLNDVHNKRDLGSIPMGMVPINQIPEISILGILVTNSVSRF